MKGGHKVHSRTTGTAKHIPVITAEAIPTLVIRANSTFRFTLHSLRFCWLLPSLRGHEGTETQEGPITCLRIHSTVGVNPHPPSCLPVPRADVFVLLSKLPPIRLIWKYRPRWARRLFSEFPAFWVWVSKTLKINWKVLSDLSASHVLKLKGSSVPTLSSSLGRTEGLCYAVHYRVLFLELYLPVTPSRKSHQTLEIWDIAIYLYFISF